MGRVETVVIPQHISGWSWDVEVEVVDGEPMFLLNWTPGSRTPLDKFLPFRKSIKKWLEQIDGVAVPLISGAL